MPPAHSQDTPRDDALFRKSLSDNSLRQTFRSPEPKVSRFESSRGYFKSLSDNILRKDQPSAKGANGLSNSLSLQVLSSQPLVFFLLTELGQAVRKLVWAKQKGHLKIGCELAYRLLCVIAAAVNDKCLDPSDFITVQFRCCCRDCFAAALTCGSGSEVAARSASNVVSEILSNSPRAVAALHRTSGSSAVRACVKARWTSGEASLIPPKAKAGQPVISSHCCLMQQQLLGSLPTHLDQAIDSQPV